MFGMEASPLLLTVRLLLCHREETSSQTPLGAGLRTPPASPTLGPEEKKTQKREEKCNFSYSGLKAVIFSLSHILQDRKQKLCKDKTCYWL